MQTEWKREAMDCAMIVPKAQVPLDLDGKGERQDGTVDQVVSVPVDGWGLYVDGIRTGVHVTDYDPCAQAEVCSRSGKPDSKGRTLSAWGAPGWGVVSLWGRRLDAGAGEGRAEIVEAGQRRALTWWPLLSERLPWREGREATLRAAQAVGAEVWSW